MKRAWPALTLALLALGVCSTAQAAEQPNVVFDLFKVLLGLIIVLAAMGGALWLIKRSGLGPAQGGGVIKVVGGVSVGNRERVLVLEVADQWIVVGVAPGQVTSIANLPRQEQFVPPVATLPANQFASWLKQKIDKRNASK